MSERDALIRAVCETPGDDTPRLVYADWLDEHEDAHRAEFIRVQVELSRRPPEVIAACEKACRPPDFEGCSHRGLKLREYSLMDTHGPLWLDAFALSVVCPGEGIRAPSDPAQAYERGAEAGRLFWQLRDSAVIRRGFVDEVHLSLAAFTEDAARALFAAHPVTRVVLTDREPGDYDGTECYWSESNAATGADAIPFLMFARLPGGAKLDMGEWIKVYPTRDLALAALSAACVAWGRSLVGLPPLPAAA